MHRVYEAMKLSQYLNDFVHILFNSGVELDTIQSCLQHARKSQIDLMNFMFSENTEEERNAVINRTTEIIDGCEIVEVSKCQDSELIIF